MTPSTFEFKFALSPSSDGGIFQSTYEDIQKIQVPTTYLPHKHSFRKLWRQHLDSLKQPGGLFSAVVDVLIAIALGDPHWKSKVQDIDPIQVEMRHVLACNLPNVIVVHGTEHYSFHIRRLDLFNYICISEDYINLWMGTEDSLPEALGLTALLINTLDHEMEH